MGGIWSAAGKSFSTTSLLKAADECRFRCPQCKMVLPRLPSLAAFTREGRNNPAHVIQHRPVVAGREPWLINMRNLCCVSGLKKIKRKRGEDGCRSVLSAQAACGSDLLC